MISEMNKIKGRLFTLAALLAVGFSIIWILPDAGSMRLSRLARHLPVEFSTFRGEMVEVTGKELQILAKDTEFERLQYVDLTYPKRPAIEVSIVFSGRDVNNSIHRPERCLDSQGWNFTKQRKIVLKGALADGGNLPVREIVCEKMVKLKDDREIKVMRVQYYTFFGHTQITESHYTRTWQDMKDRLCKGYDQQWAYATFSMPVTKVYADQGMMDPRDALTVEQTEKALSDFIRKLAPLVIDQEAK